MSLRDLLLTALMGYHSLTAGSTYRTEAGKGQAERLGDIATAITLECEAHPIPGWPERGCVAFVATVAKWESGLLREIHSGEKVGPAGELCLVQLHRGVTRIPDRRFRITEEERLASPGLGLEATRRCIALGLRILTWHVVRCRIPFRNGAYGSANILFTQYHHPSQQRPGAIHGTFVCVDGPISPLAARRSESYQHLLRALDPHIFGD